MKVAVYAIAKDEQSNVAGWVESASGADVLLIADTGSTDGTAASALLLGVTVIDVAISPWRFDDARNAALAALPRGIDYCIALDLDERLQPGWREALEAASERGLSRPSYKYTWNWNDDGSPGLQYLGDKIHSRHGYRWRNPVHETLQPYGCEESRDVVPGLEIHHHADMSKARGMYLPMLAMAVNENPHDDRNAHYFARELMYYGQVDAAITEFRRHLALPSAVWAPERANSMRWLGDLTHDSAWYAAAIETCPDRREPWLSQARHQIAHGEYVEAIGSVNAALAIAERPLEYLCEADAWSWLPFDLLASAYHGLEADDVAADHAQTALTLAPAREVPRLLQNLVYFSGVAAGGDR